MEITDINEVTRRVIGSAIAVHRELGPGLFESAYSAALEIAMREDGLRFRMEPVIPVRYKERVIGSCRPDFIVEEAVVLEIKRSDWLDTDARIQILNYLRVAGRKVGLLINFRTHPLKRGIRRFIL
jgi:GxxExxY protein